MANPAIRSAEFYRFLLYKATRTELAHRQAVLRNQQTLAFDSKPRTIAPVKPAFGLAASGWQWQGSPGDLDILERALRAARRAQSIEHQWNMNADPNEGVALALIEKLAIAPVKAPGAITHL